ncbi:Rrf2 family transcriptional regulator [Candidatus Desantisbacteria bacterium CG1_02_38_46]|uniref:Rrf2 family transcriptional regulator n=2 Tax=unclassified Candidatus Desantisiibacteriota TaxID=3106372 RepID=A0A1J4SGV6_9BACT|nr:MAG: Rrf2 family transcriptional regulator [Candidatus Desantisbacteria bacterium CG1_02_38_46]PIU51436.1 MAG: Rrf2 family transcriptional regulator [Candidatus Desantisbacteria bacterium CG07_land_8_20_14_0_80_39_15]
MKLSTKVRYGMRAMLELAVGYGKGPILLRVIGKKQKISEKYLEQLLVPLKSTGLIKSIRGPNGGYILSKSPAQLKLSEIVDALEGPTCLVGCIEDPKTCSFVESCVTRDVWIEMQEAIKQILNSITLENLVERQQKKKVILGTIYHI